jgi:hypothetical protein
MLMGLIPERKLRDQRDLFSALSVPSLLGFDLFSSCGLNFFGAHAFPVRRWRGTPSVATDKNSYDQCEKNERFESHYSWLYW